MTHTITIEGHQPDEGLAIGEYTVSVNTRPSVKKTFPFKNYGESLNAWNCATAFADGLVAGLLKSKLNSVSLHNKDDGGFCTFYATKEADK